MTQLGRHSPREDFLKSGSKPAYHSAARRRLSKRHARKRVVQSSSFGFRDFARDLPLLERLFLGVTAAFGAFLRLGGVMIPLGWVGRFLGGFSAVVG
jgi:hypothetical protein